MEGSKERIRFIIEYISAYEQKIKLANKNGLFDEAQLFELFAQEICKLWYGQSFINLNTIKKNYPCVDLLSNDGTLYVQVSTQTDIFDKIKKTLRSLDQSNSPDLAKVTSPIFFVLSNESEESVKDLIGEKQIGKYPFTVEKNMISTSKIVQRAKNEVDFQNALYELLMQDVKGIESVTEKLLYIFDNSKSVHLYNIDTTINGEFEIDRTALVSRIKADDNQFVFICGEAGSGKSVICKKILEDEEKVLFARADKLANCHSIDDIWGISITKTFRFLQGKRAIIYIDALEYIANAGESIKELVQSLLTEIKRYSNLFFMASCRSCDVSAFIKLLGLFSIKEYVVEPITDNELKEICKKYPVIKEAAETDKYSEIIRSPFYINEIVSKRVNLAEASDVNAFRTFIWKECICLNGKAAEKGIPTNTVVQTVKQLVVERSRRFITGIPEEEIDLKILRLLRSNNVVTDKDSLVRLKYDIYEDICFEKLFDEEFDDCKGRYSTFFNNIEKMGNGAYRRYQIWIGNKLLAKVNRDKFLQTLVFDNEISPEWHRNTIIGLVKSPFCISFFKEQGTNLIEKKMVPEFVDITNLFSFEMSGVSFNKIKSICWLQLKAVGYGRIALIDLIYENELYKNEYLDRKKIIKLCNDYAVRSKHMDKTDEYTCSIMSYYVDEYMREISSDFRHRAVDYLSPLLGTIYSLPIKAHSWINKYWNELKKSYLERNITESRIAEEILEWTLENVTITLVDNELEGLLEIAAVIWTKENERNKRRHDIYGERYSDDYSWGVRGAGENYNYAHVNIDSDVFLRFIFQRRFDLSLNWTIEIINQMVSEYSSHEPDDFKEVVLLNCDDNTEKKYIGSGSMWFAGREEGMLPALIGDLVYWLKESAIQILHILESDKNAFNCLALYVKTQILEKSTNIIPFTIIEDIGFEFADIIPGYAVLLASNLDIITWDFQWTVKNIHSPATAIIEEQLMMSVGIPSLKGRYPRRQFKYQGLQNYMAWSQLFCEEKVCKRCISVLEYLYNMIDTNNAHILLQVQKMDMRNAKVNIIDDGVVSVEPILSDESQKIVNDNETKKQPEEDIINKLKKILEGDNSDNLEIVLEEIDNIKSLMSEPENAIKYEHYYIMFICIALKNQNLSKAKRTELVCDWAGRIKNIFSHIKLYVADLKLSEALFQQYWRNIDNIARNHLKDLMLFCLIDRTSDGQIALLRSIVLFYLSNHETTARILFNTVIGIAKDEWEHYSYNQELLDKNKDKNYCIPAGYGVPKPDDIVKALGLKLYKSKREEIVKRFLYDEEMMDISELDVNEMDPGFLFCAVNTGIRLDDPDFRLFVKKIMPVFINSMDGDRRSSLMEKYYERQRVKEMFVRELADIKNYKTAVDLLFDDDLLNSFGRESAKMYLSIFGNLASQYFDSYKDRAKRSHCRACIEYVEKKIEKIPDSYVKNQMEKILIFGSDPMAGDWNECETHYSFEDKRFICKLWGKYCCNHVNDILNAIYKMKIGELLPEVLPIVCNTADSLKNRSDILEENSWTILKTFVLKALLDFSDKIKADYEYHDSFEKLLNILIDFGDESAAVILDEYRTH